jgi:small subunit ribosomal protein S8
MAVTDQVADLLTRIRNANMAGHDHVEVTSSRLNQEIVKILQSEGFVRSHEIVKGKVQNRIKVALKYGPRREKVITDLQRVSRPGRRVYTKRGDVPRVLGGLGIAILSTSSGLMTDREARKLGVGGEVLCQVW